MPYFKYRVLAVLAVALPLLGAGCVKNNSLSPNTGAVNSSPALVSSLVTVEAKSGFSGYVVKKDGQPVADLPNPGQQPKNYQLIRQTASFAYLGETPTGLGGYIIFDTGAYALFRLDLRTNEIKKIVGPETAAVMDISRDDQWAAWAFYSDSERKIILANLTDGSAKSFLISKAYNQFGDLHFSPDSSKLAYSAAVGFPGKEAGAVFVIDIKTEATSLVEKTARPDSYFRVRGWRGDSVEYELK